MPALIGLHLGVRRAYAVAIDDQGTILATAADDYRLNGNAAEQDPAEWWRAAGSVLAAVSSALSGAITAIGLTGHGGCVFLDQRGEAIRPALLGTDGRADSQHHDVQKAIGSERLLAITGGYGRPDSQAALISWLRDVEPVQYRHTHRVLAPKDYIRLRLTGEAVTDVSQASGTTLLDLRTRSWSSEILDALGIAPESLPFVLECEAVSGGLRPSVAAELGLPAGIPVAAGATEEVAAAVGRGGIEPGMISSFVEDDALLLTPSGQPVSDPAGRLAAGCFARPALDHLIARGAGSAVIRWWARVLGKPFTSDDVFALARTSVEGSNGLFFVPADDSSAAPWPAAGRGGFVGLRAHHRRADLTRALVEGIVFSLRRSLDRMRELGIPATHVRASGGGAGGTYLRRLQADILNLPVVAASRRSRPIGAALLGGVAAGVFPTLADASRLAVRTGETIVPEPQRAATYERIYATFSALEPALRTTAGR
jgi:xylulokinase